MAATSAKIIGPRGGLGFETGRLDIVKPALKFPGRGPQSVRPRVVINFCLGRTDQRDFRRSDYCFCHAGGS